jgi:hypothetical protein
MHVGNTARNVSRFAGSLTLAPLLPALRRSKSKNEVKQK